MKKKFQTLDSYLGQTEWMYDGSYILNSINPNKRSIHPNKYVWGQSIFMSKNLSPKELHDLIALIKEYMVFSQGTMKIYRVRNFIGIQPSPSWDVK